MRRGRRAGPGRLPFHSRVRKNKGSVVEVSLDHGLGDEPDVGTGYDVACAIEAAAAKGTIEALTWAIHSANPVGRGRMEAALRNADRFWGRSE